jgi:hypothetical protein
MVRMGTVEILDLFLLYIGFYKFLEILEPMCVSPCNIQSKFLAAQRQEVRAKFSPTEKVGRDLDQHIR